MGARTHARTHRLTRTQNRAGLFLNLLDFLAHHHRIVAPNLLGTVFPVVERALVLVAVPVHGAEQAAASALESCGRHQTEREMVSACTGSLVGRVVHLPVRPTFLRHTLQRFFFFFESLSSDSLSSWSSLMEGPALSLCADSSGRNFCAEKTQIETKRKRLVDMWLGKWGWGIQIHSMGLGLKRNEMTQVSAWTIWTIEPDLRAKNSLYAIA